MKSRNINQVFWKPELNETSTAVNETHSEFKIDLMFPRPLEI